MRIGCLLVPDLPLQALVRAEPELGKVPLAVAEGEGGRARVLHVSAHARAEGVTPGLPVSDALALSPGLLVRWAEPALVESARSAVLDAAASVSPNSRAAVMDSAATMSSPTSPRARLRRISTSNAASTGTTLIVHMVDAKSGLSAAYADARPPRRPATARARSAVFTLSPAECSIPKTLLGGMLE